MKKIALFVFNGDPMCFIHVLLNAIDMNEKEYDVKIIIEGSATKLIPELSKKSNPLSTLWEKVKSLNLVDGVCKACATKLGTIDAVKQENLTILDDMSGHPSMTGYMDKGFKVISF